MGFFSGLGSSLVSGALGLFGGAQTNASNAKELATNNAFNERMSNTAHQRETADLLAAGLNPILSGTGGSGANSPTAGFIPAVNSVQNGLNSAMDAKKLANENQAQENSNKLIKEQIDKTKQDTELSRTSSISNLNNTANQNALTQANLIKIKADTLGSIASAKNAQANNVLLNSEIPRAQNEAKFQKDVGEMSPWARTLIQGAKDVLGTVHSAKSLSK